MSSESALRLAEGRVIKLETLYQERIYSGLLEGYPTNRLNRQIIQELLDRQR